MRALRILISVLVLVLTAGSAWALEQNELAFAPQGGYARLTGNLGDLFADDFAYGAAFAYGITDIFGVESDFLYSAHEAEDKTETGNLTLTHFVAGLGPRINWPTQYVAPYLAVLGGAALMKYKARWQTADEESHQDNTGAHAFGGMLSAGIDAFISQGVTLGIGGRAGYFNSSFRYNAKGIRDQAAGSYAYYAGVVRVSLLF